MKPSQGLILMFLFGTAFSTASAQLYTPGAGVESVTNGTSNVGIGITNPAYKLDVMGMEGNWKARFQGPDGYIMIGPANTYFAHIYTDRTRFLFNKGVYSTPGIFSSYLDTDLSLQTYGTTRITVSHATGNVGIGTTSPNEKLTVNGTIYGKEVKVDLNVPAPDYVFEKDYRLPSLSDLETYINENKHLPEVPSAKEMEENGLNLKEMNLILLKKVEELTLHLIEQNKKIESMEKKLKTK